jgi:uncharacterized membrane protein
MARLTSRHWAIALFSSLAVNVFLAGLVATSYIHRDRDAALRMTVYTVPWAFRTIGTDAEPKARKVFHKYRAALATSRENLHRDYKLTTDALLAPQFDRARFGAALERLRSDLSSAQATMHDGMVDFVADLSPEQRQELAVRVNEWAEQRQHRALTRDEEIEGRPADQSAKR